MGSGSSRRRGTAGHRRALPAEGEGAAALPGPGRPAQTTGSSAEPRAGGSSAEAAGGGGGAPLQQAALSTSSPPGPENNNLDHHCKTNGWDGSYPYRNSVDDTWCLESNKKPLGQSTILYDYSEEELMASIEREYCR